MLHYGFFFKGRVGGMSMVLTSYLATAWLMQSGDRRRPHEQCRNLWAALSHHYYYCHFTVGSSRPLGEDENPYISGGLIHPELPISLPGRWRFRECTGFHRSHSSDRPSEIRNQSRAPLGAGSWSVPWTRLVLGLLLCAVGHLWRVLG